MVILLFLCVVGNAAAALMWMQAGRSALALVWWIATMLWLVSFLKHVMGVTNVPY